jgi:hypothetical protein
MSKTHYLVIWGYFPPYEEEIPDMVDPILVDAYTPDEAIKLYPHKSEWGHAHVVGTVPDTTTPNGEPRLASEAIPMAAYPQFCDWTDESFGKLNSQYKKYVNTLYQQWLGKVHIETVHVSGESHKPDQAELLKEIDQLRKFKKNVERCLDTEYQKLYQAGFVKAMMASHEDGTFQFDLNMDCPLREELAKANYWKRYYEDKYLALLPDEERNPPPQAKET